MPCVYELSEHEVMNKRNVIDRQVGVLLNMDI